LIFQAFFFFLLFQKKRIEGGKKFKRKNIFSGDFDVFRPARLCGSQSAPQPLVVAKKQSGKRELPPTR